MARYYLAASYYDKQKKTYTNQITINNINGIKLSSLDKIDSFTSEHTSLEIFNMIEKELNINNINHLAIKYLKKNDSPPKYYKVITSDKLFNECIKSMRKTKITILDKTRDTYLVNRNNPLFKQELTKLLEIINKKDINEFYKNYPYSSKINDLSFLVERYLNTSYDNDMDKEKDLELILLEFSRYKTFRGWFIEQIKLKYNITSNQKINQQQETTPKQKNKTPPKSIEENIEQYEKKFAKKI